MTHRQIMNRSPIYCPIVGRIGSKHLNSATPKREPHSFDADTLDPVTTLDTTIGHTLWLSGPLQILMTGLLYLSPSGDGYSNAPALSSQTGRRAGSWERPQVSALSGVARGEAKRTGHDSFLDVALWISFSGLAAVREGRFSL
jgi:hypothetical protein